MNSVRKGWAAVNQPAQVGFDKKVECVCECGNRRWFYWMDWESGRLPTCSCHAGELAVLPFKDHDSAPVSEFAMMEWRLVSHGYLPPSTGSTKTGSPVWNLAGVAQILGISEMDLLVEIRKVRINGGRDA